MKCTLTATPRTPTILACEVAKENPSMCIWFSHVPTNRVLPRTEETFQDLCLAERFHRPSDLLRLLWPEMRLKIRLDLLMHSNRVPIALLPAAIPIHTCTRCLHLTLTEENTIDSNIHRMATLRGDHNQDPMGTEEHHPPAIIPILLLLTVITGTRGHQISPTWKESPVTPEPPQIEVDERRFVPIQDTPTMISEGLPPLEAMANVLLPRRINKTSYSRCLSNRRTNHTFITFRLRRHRAFLLHGEIPAKECVLPVTPRNFRCFRFPATTAAIANTTRVDGSRHGLRFRRGHRGHTDRRWCDQFCEQDTLLVLVRCSILIFLQNCLFIGSRLLQTGWGGKRNFVMKF
mmetsp:Transcript_7406/g.18134  ORF Transcript_7406/g.18134 Transcript_7406/m.18134 type:complete len:347 (+) Transcript_7406:208-1248(+)